MVHARDRRLHVHLSVLTWFVRFILGMLVVLFFNCMAALFNPVYRRGEGIKWVLVFLTVAMFSLETVIVSMGFNTLSVAYIDNREFPGTERAPVPGPLGYQMAHYTSVTAVIPSFAGVLNNSLADGLLVSSLFDTAFTSPSI